MSSNKVCDNYSESALLSPGRDSCECREGLRSRGGFCSVEEVVVYQDRVEALCFTELGAFKDSVERFAGGEEDSASELDTMLHSLVPEPLSLSHLGYEFLQLHVVNTPVDGYDG